MTVDYERMTSEVFNTKADVYVVTKVRRTLSAQLLTQLDQTTSQPGGRVKVPLITNNVRNDATSAVCLTDWMWAARIRRAS